MRVRRVARAGALACFAALLLIGCNDALGIRPPSDQILDAGADAADSRADVEDDAGAD